MDGLFVSGIHTTCLLISYGEQFFHGSFWFVENTGLKLPDVLSMLLGKSGTLVSIGLIRNGSTVIAKLVRSTTALAPLAPAVPKSQTVVSTFSLLEISFYILLLVIILVRNDLNFVIRIFRSPEPWSAHGMEQDNPFTKSKV